MSKTHSIIESVLLMPRKRDFDEGPAIFISAFKTETAESNLKLHRDLICQAMQHSLILVVKQAFCTASVYT